MPPEFVIIRSDGDRSIDQPCVVFCLDNSGIGGTELNAVRTAERLVRRGVGVEVVSLGRQAELTARYEHAGVPVHVFPMESLASVSALGQGMRLYRLLRERRIQVFHAQDIYGNIFGIPWARLAGIPAVLASRRWWKTSTRRGHDRANRIVCSLAHAVVANSPRVAERARQAAGSRCRVEVVPNYVDADAFEAPDAMFRRRLLREMDVPDGRSLIGCIANLRPVKDHATLFHALARVTNAGHDAHLVLVGDGELRGDLARLADDLEMGDRVSFAGRKPHTPNLHHLFDISTLTSTNEAFSNSLLEAMAAEKPVVATRVGGTPDAVVEGETGLLVPPGEPSALAAAFEQLLGDPGLMRRMGRKGRERVREHFSPETALKALTGLYMDILNERSPGSVSREEDIPERDSLGEVPAS